MLIARQPRKLHALHVERGVHDVVDLGDPGSHLGFVAATRRAHGCLRVGATTRCGDDRRHRDENDRKSHRFFPNTCGARLRPQDYRRSPSFEGLPCQSQELSLLGECGGGRRGADEALLLRFFFLTRVRPLLEQFPRRVDVNRAPAARVFAQPAARALLLVEHRHAEEVADGAVRVAQAQRLERAYLDAQLAAAADAVVLDDDGLRPLLTRERPADITDRVEDRLRRAYHAARPTVDAQRRVNDVYDVARPCDRVCRAALRTSRTADACVDDCVSQNVLLGATARARWSEPSNPGRRDVASPASRSPAPSS